MGDLTRNFSRSEFACRGENCCGGSAPVSILLVHALQLLHDDISAVIGGSITINVHSGFRCLTHDIEEAIKRGETPEAAAVRNSPHCRGIAADIDVPSVTPGYLACIAEGIPEFRDGGIGIYPWGVHLDVREDGPARWQE